jgi:ABC-type multidrug transport system fused ATPase/permease subunit
MSVDLEAHVRRVRAAWGRAAFALGPLTRLVAPIGGLSILAGFFEAGVLALTAEIAFAMSEGEPSTDIALGPLLVEAKVPQLLGIALGFAVLRVAVQWLLALLTARMNASAQTRLRRKLFHAYSDAAWSVQSQDGDGQLQEMMTSHSKSAGQAAGIVAAVLAPLSSFIILVGSAVLLSPPIAIAVAAAAVGIFLVLRPFGRMTWRQAALHSTTSLSLAKGVGEAVHLTEEMHVYGTAPQHRERVDHLIDDVEAPFFRTHFLSLVVPAMFQGLALILVIAGLSVLYALGSENLAALGAIVLLLVRALSYGQQLQHVYQKLNEVAPFLDRILKEVARYADSAPEFGSQSLPETRDLTFDRVSFAYDSRQSVLDEVSFRVDSGETVGIVGLSGAGKSTLVQLLLRLREPDSGVYRVDSTDVRQIASDDWQRRVAYVSQEARLLGGTVTENIRYLRDHITGEAIVTAAKMAHIHEEILSWPGGYDHRVGQRVDAVSGGQRQRLCLARALAGKPEILVLDEPTSALDPHSEVAIQESLEELRGAVTMFIVAHRMSTLTTCDRIMVIESGRIEAFDTPENLRRVNGYFRSAMEIAGASARRDGS